MAKETTGLIKLQVPGGKATPAPPVGPALGQHGVNIGEFVQRFNAETASQQGLVIPVVITVYSDRTFDLAFKSPPAAVLIKKAVGLEKAANDPGHEVVAKISNDQIKEIAETKMNDLNAATIEAAMLMIAGTARSMGIEVGD
ncbi:MAG: 50S ribosomal protein L11 [Planctomycetia bacterium]|nr:50S ribosomal protein L11 [Planctomycetia bacterium]MBL6915038.1 50S ribosomal protein L11 [Planctomycetota bacterium]HCW45283.1 50S ribosomal protein L11 [Planctomycetota bacterium]